MTTTLKNIISLDNLQSQYLLNSGWSSGDEISTLTKNLGDVFKQI